MFKNAPVVVVAAISRKRRAIGVNNQLLWHIPADIKRFKKLTLGHPIIIGRLTFESIIEILGKPLPGRTNIVLTKNQHYKPKGAIVGHSLETALTVASDLKPTEIHIGGGSQIYQAAWPLVDKLHLTLVDDEPVGDAFFPDYNQDFFITKNYGPMKHGDLAYEWVDLERKRAK